MISNTVKVEQMDPDFGRHANVGEGFGTIAEQEYAQMVNELDNKQEMTAQTEQMDPDFGRHANVGEGFGSISAEEYAHMIAELTGE